jgi:adenosylhomocysteine nucleosidase
VVDDVVPSPDILFVMAAEAEFRAELRRRISPIITGVGPFEAALGTGLHLSNLVNAGRPPKLVVSLGSAASLRCPIGAIYQISGVSWRDMNASKFGFAKGVTPFTGLSRVIDLQTPIPFFPTATLSTGGDVLGGEEIESLGVDLVDMETFAVVRACMRFGLPVIGLRGVSDGPCEVTGINSWTDALQAVDEGLALAVDRLIAASAEVDG